MSRLNRNSLRLLIEYSSADEVDPLEVRKFLDDLSDRSSEEGRLEFQSRVQAGEYPFNAIRAEGAHPGDVSLAIDRAPPALVLILHEVEYDDADPRDAVPDSIDQVLTEALARWDLPLLEQLVQPNGWAESPPEQPVQELPPVDPPSPPTPPTNEPPTPPTDSTDSPPTDTPSPAPPDEASSNEEAQFLFGLTKKQLLVRTLIASTVVGAGYFALRQK